MLFSRIAGGKCNSCRVSDPNGCQGIEFGTKVIIREAIVESAYWEKKKIEFCLAIGPVS